MNPAPFLLLTILLAAPLLAAAQTNTDSAPPTTNAAPAAATTPAPADSAPPATNAAPAATTTPEPADTAPAPAAALVPASPPPQTNTQTIPVQADAAQQEEIDDIRPPYFFLHPRFWLWIALATGAVLALIALLWHLFKPHRLLSAKSAYDLTLEKLEKARTMLREDYPMPYAVFVSETVRDYLGLRFETPSTRRTTDEFLRLMENNPNTPLAEHRDLLRHFLQSCDLVKFARYQPTLDELEDVQQRAWNFVTATKPFPAPRNGSLP
jgi:hypothetical protein